LGVSAPRGLLSRWIVEKPANPLLWLYQERWVQAYEKQRPTTFELIKMTKNNYYFLTIKDYKKVASAFAPEETKLAHELISELYKTNELPFELNLVKLSVEHKGLVKDDNLSDLENIWLDFQPNSLAWPIMSERFKDLICRNLTGQENIDWIRAKINGNNESRIYYILRFGKMHDVLDVVQTLYVEGTDHIIRPHFSLEKIKELSVFNKPASHDLWKITSGIYINEHLKNMIIKEKLLGIAFEKVRAS